MRQTGLRLSESRSDRVNKLVPSYMKGMGVLVMAGALVATLSLHVA